MNGLEVQMPAPQGPEIDKGYFLMAEIEANHKLSQRELSHRTGLSLGSVNLLLQRMIRQGLVKMETIPANRVAYMLTPKGMAEKAVKTVQYIRRHYHIIEETRCLIASKLLQCHQQYETIYVCKPGNELDTLVETAVREYLAEYPDRVVRILDDAGPPHCLPAMNTPNAVILYLPGEAAGHAPAFASTTPIPLISLLDPAG